VLPTKESGSSLRDNLNDEEAVEEEEKAIDLSGGSDKILKELSCEDSAEEDSVVLDLCTKRTQKLEKDDVVEVKVEEEDDRDKQKEEQTKVQSDIASTKFLSKEEEVIEKSIVPPMEQGVSKGGKGSENRKTAATCKEASIASCEDEQTQSVSVAVESVADEDLSRKPISLETVTIALERDRLEVQPTCGSDPEPALGPKKHDSLELVHVAECTDVGDVCDVDTGNAEETMANLVSHGQGEPIVPILHDDQAEKELLDAEEQYSDEKVKIIHISNRVQASTAAPKTDKLDLPSSPPSDIFSCSASTVAGVKDSSPADEVSQSFVSAQQSKEEGTSMEVRQSSCEDQSLFEQNLVDGAAAVESLGALEEKSAGVGSDQGALDDTVTNEEKKEVSVATEKQFPVQKIIELPKNELDSGHKSLSPEAGKEPSTLANRNEKNESDPLALYDPLGQASDKIKMSKSSEEMKIDNPVAGTSSHGTDLSKSSKNDMGKDKMTTTGDYRKTEDVGDQKSQKQEEPEKAENSPEKVDISDMTSNQSDDPNSGAHQLEKITSALSSVPLETDMSVGTNVTTAATSLEEKTLDLTDFLTFGADMPVSRPTVPIVALEVKTSSNTEKLNKTTTATSLGEITSDLSDDPIYCAYQHDSAPAVASVSLDPKTLSSGTDVTQELSKTTTATSLEEKTSDLSDDLTSDADHPVSALTVPHLALEANTLLSGKDELSETTTATSLGEITSDLSDNLTSGADLPVSTPTVPSVVLEAKTLPSVKEELSETATAASLVEKISDLSHDLISGADQPVSTPTMPSVALETKSLSSDTEELSETATATSLEEKASHLSDELTSGADQPISTTATGKDELSETTTAASLEEKTSDLSDDRTSGADLPVSTPTVPSVALEAKTLPSGKDELIETTTVASLEEKTSDLSYDMTSGADLSLSTPTVPSVPLEAKTLPSGKEKLSETTTATSLEEMTSDLSDDLISGTAQPVRTPTVSSVALKAKTLSSDTEELSKTTSATSLEDQSDNLTSGAEKPESTPTVFSVAREKRTAISEDEPKESFREVSAVPTLIERPDSLGSEGLPSDHDLTKKAPKTDYEGARQVSEVAKDVPSGDDLLSESLEMSLLAPCQKRRVSESTDETKSPAPESEQDVLPCAKLPSEEVKISPSEAKSTVPMDAKYCSSGSDLPEVCADAKTDVAHLENASLVLTETKDSTSQPGSPKSSNEKSDKARMVSEEVKDSLSGQGSHAETNVETLEKSVERTTPGENESVTVGVGEQATSVLPSDESEKTSSPKPIVIKLGSNYLSKKTSPSEKETSSVTTSVATPNVGNDSTSVSGPSPNSPKSSPELDPAASNKSDTVRLINIGSHVVIARDATGAPSATTASATSAATKCSSSTCSVNVCDSNSPIPAASSAGSSPAPQQQQPAAKKPLLSTPHQIPLFKSPPKAPPPPPMSTPSSPSPAQSSSSEEDDEDDDEEDLLLLSESPSLLVKPALSSSVVQDETAAKSSPPAISSSLVYHQSISTSILSSSSSSTSSTAAAAANPFSSLKSSSSSSASAIVEKSAAAVLPEGRENDFQTAQQATQQTVVTAASQFSTLENSSSSSSIIMQSEEAGDKSSSLSCNVCGKECRNEADLNLHKKRHKVDAPFICQFCSREYVDRNRFDVHIRLHTGKSMLWKIFHLYNYQVRRSWHLV
jgi:hypothetical protein